MDSFEISNLNFFFFQVGCTYFTFIFSFMCYIMTTYQWSTTVFHLFMQVNSSNLQNSLMQCNYCELKFKLLSISVKTNESQGLSFYSPRA